MLGGVFISYRREDSGGFAGRIYDRLANKLGRESVFFDVDNIALGLDFVEVLSERVGRCDALVAVIGRDWISSVDKGNRRRLDDPDDFVRIEIEAALARGVRVIPVLVDGATMPKREDLPDSLKNLTRRQAIEISHTRFDSDVEILTRVLSALEDDLRQRQAEEAERAAREERQKREAAEAAEKGEQDRRVAEAEALRAIEERRAREAAEAKRAAREAAEKAEQARRLAEAEAQRADEERRAREAAEAERAAREKREKRQAAESVEKAEQAGRPAKAATEAGWRLAEEHVEKEEIARKAEHLFISYCNEDEAEAQSLVNDIENRGPQCWFALRDVQFNYQKEIVEAIRSALALIVVISERANSSDEIPKEVSLARKYRVRTIPVRIEDTWPSGALEYELSNAQNVDLFKGRDAAIGRIIRLLGPAK